MDFGVGSAGVLWLAVMVVAITASCLVAVAVSAVRASHNGWELFGELVVVSVLVPTGLMYAATHLPPELFEFLK